MNNIIKKGINSSLIHSEIIKVSDHVKKSDEHLEGWKRARADYENLHARMTEEISKARKEGKIDAIRSFLDVIDYFDSAFASMPKDLEKNDWANGIKYIQKAFLDSLVRMGITTVGEIGEKFDPQFHEPLEHVASDEPEGTIVLVIAKGYVMGDTVLRPARVKVSSGSSEKT